MVRLVSDKIFNLYLLGSEADIQDAIPEKMQAQCSQRDISFYKFPFPCARVVRSGPCMEMGGPVSERPDPLCLPTVPRLTDISHGGVRRDDGAWWQEQRWQGLNMDHSARYDGLCRATACHSGCCESCERLGLSQSSKSIDPAGCFCNDHRIPQRFHVLGFRR